MREQLRHLLRGSPLLHRVRFAFHSVPYAVLSRTVKVRPSRVLFLSDSRSGYTGNFVFLRDEIARQQPDAEVIGIFKPRLDSRRPLRDTLRLSWTIATAQTIILDDYYPLIYSMRIRPESRLLQVWHAAGAFKRVGWSRKGLPGGPLPGSLAHKNYTDATVSSEQIRPDYAEAFGIDISRVHALGVPRTDAFFDGDRVARSAQDVRARYGIPDSHRIVLFTPTFRGDGQGTATFDYDSVPWESLADELGDGWTVMVKMHPFVAPLTVARPHVTGVIDVSQDRELTDLMMAADVLVTDYSSAIFEYALLNRPIVFFCPDLEEYTASRDFYHPFADYLAGPLVRDAAELAAHIRNASPGETLSTFVDEFMSACDGGSSTRIVRDIVLRPRVTASVQHASVAPASGPEPTRVSTHIRARIVVAWLARTLLSAIYAPLKLLPVQRKVVLLSREHPTEPQDFADLREAIVQLDPAVKVISLVRMVPPGVVGKALYAMHMLRQLFHVATARVLILDTYSIVASVLRHREELTVIQIWHALGAFKKFGKSILGKPEGRDERIASAMRMHEGYDLVLASGPAAVPAYAEAFGTEPEKIRVLPLPRVDRLSDPALLAQTRERIHSAYPHLRSMPVALFAPTFRLDGEISVDVRRLAAALNEIGVHLVVKLHPLMQATFQDVDDAPGFSTQELLAVADVFITDYSSAMFEAAVVGVPSYFFSPDMDSYLASRDFYLDYRTDLPGPVLISVPELVEAIRSGRAPTEQIDAFLRRWVAIPGDDAPSVGERRCARALAKIVVEETRSPSVVDEP